MSSSLAPFSSLIPSPLAPRFLQTLTQFPNSPFLSSCSFLRLKNASLLNLRTRIALLQPQRVRSKTPVLSAESSFLKVLRTAWNIGKDGIEAGTNLVPVSVPRSVARISVTIAALAVSLFVVKSFLSTAFFVLVSENEANAIKNIVDILKTDSELQPKRLQGLFLSLAILCSKLEDCRCSFVSLQVLDLLINALRHKDADVRAAACICLRNASRSVKLINRINTMRF